MKLNIQKLQEGYAVLNTYYPFISKYPYTGHSSLQVPSSEKGFVYISKGSNDPDYNLITNNCSDATRCGLEKAFNKKMNPFLFTTPGDVQDFALNELNGIPKIKGDSIYDPNEHKYKLDARSEKLKKRHKGESTVYIPLNEKQRIILKQHIREIRLNNLRMRKVKLQEGNKIPTFSLPEINVYPNNRWGDIARSQGLETARNWRKVKGGTTKGINDFANDPRTQFVSMMLPLPSGIDTVGGKVAGVVDRITDKPRRVSSMVEYFSPFGYQLFNTYDGKIPEALRWLNGYVLNGRDIPKGGGWSVQRMKIEPFRTESRKQAFRRYLGAPKPTDKLYIENTDGTFRYNPDIIPKENIEYQRQHFIERGNGNSASEYLTSDIHGAKGARPGNAGGLISKIDSDGNFIIDDTWDLMPLQQFKWLPKSIQNIEFGKFIGGKPFRVYDTEIGKIK